jgi:membrane-associated protease RseP (regulator of RpoE activity)
MVRYGGRLTPESRGLRKLLACESAAVGSSSGAPPVLPAPYPDLDAEAASVEALLPSFLGVQFEPLSARMSRKLDAPGAVRIKSVSADSPAEAAGIEVGDVLVSIQDVRLQTPYAIMAQIALAERSAPVRVAGSRDGAPVDFELTLVPRN